MWNIIKAQNYQTKGDNAVIYGFLVCMVLLAFAGVLDGASIADMTGSLYLVGAGAVLPFALIIITLVLTARICGADMADKTINYEVMAGHDRGEVYWGRVIASVIWGMAGGVLLTFLPLAFFGVVHGWGHSMSLAGAAARLVLLLFPMFRLICEFALLTFCLKNCYTAMVIGWVLCSAANICSMIAEEAGVTISMWFASTNMMSLLTLENYAVEYIGGEDVAVYETALSQPLALGSVVISLAVGIACLLLGYVYFKRTDMN